MRIESKENDYDTMKQTIEDLQCQLIEKDEIIDGLKEDLEKGNGLS